MHLGYLSEEFVPSSLEDLEDKELVRISTLPTPLLPLKLED